MKKHNLHVPKIGMRKIKSLIAIILAFGLWQIIKIPIPNMSVHPLFGYVYAIIEMRHTYEETETFGLRRIKSTFIGLFFGLIFTSLSVYLSAKLSENMAIFVDVVMILLGVLISLWVAELLKCENFCGVAAIIFVICVIRDRDTGINVYLYSVMRVVQTLLGVFSAWVVNRFICKYPKEETDELNGN